MRRWREGEIERRGDSGFNARASIAGGSPSLHLSCSPSLYHLPAFPPSLRRIVGSLLALCLSVGAAAGQAAEKPALVVQITVDQLRGDLPLRYRERFGAGGFRRLMDKGVCYRNAHFRHAATVTAAGHATLFTGGHGLQHGITGNDWVDRRTGKHLYCVADPASPVLGEGAGEDDGRSPRNLMASTIGDVLVMASAGQARVFSVSGKDRGAILPGGRLGKAFWFSSATGRFVTSKYYYHDYPGWARQWNDARPTDAYRGRAWTLLADPGTYLHRELDDRDCERGFKTLGRTFPHALSGDNLKDVHSAVRYTPFGDELALAFARELVTRERVGQGAATDFLAVSLSSMDYIGHAFGPESLEVEDHMLHLDRMLADWFAFLDEKVGAGRALIVLSSDHGAGESPECVEKIGFDAGRFYPRELMKKVNAALKERLGVQEDLVAAFWNPGFFLDPAAVARAKLTLEDAERAAADALRDEPGVALAVTRGDLLAGRLPDDPIFERIQRSFHPDRSPHVYVVQKPFWYLYPDPETYAAMHGSPYAYDTYVPIMIAGPGITPKQVYRPIGPEDIAPTLAALLEIQPPSGSVGTPLREIVGE